MGRFTAVGVTSGHGCIMIYTECCREDATANELSDFEHAPAGLRMHVVGGVLLMTRILARVPSA